LTGKGLLTSSSSYQQNLKGKQVSGTICYMGGWPFVYELFSYSWGKMIQYTTTHHQGFINYDTIRSSSHAYARNIAAQNMKGDWILMLDTDIQFDPDIAVRMIETMEKYELHVLTGLYLYKKDPHYPVLYSYNQRRKKYQIISSWNLEGNEVFEIAAAGAGCLLVKKWVFQYIKQQLHEDAFDIRRPFDNKKEKQLGEDLSFFDRCRQLDIQVFCSPSITVDHIFPHPLILGRDHDSTLKRKSKQFEVVGLKKHLAF